MRVLGFNGREYSWNLAKYNTSNMVTKNRSKYHLKAREIISSIYHSYVVLEEVKLPGSVIAEKKSVLYFDFFLPNLRLAIEVHGQQHYEYTPFFHKNKAAFLQGLNRDEDKARWCELNDIELIVLKYSGAEDEWREQLRPG